jgi:tetratricopeptide (TPR) repeat protein
LHTPLQPDALVIQIKLLAACTAPTWQKYATQAVELAHREAPNHPRLPNSLMFYHDMRGEYEEALHWADRAIASGPTPEDVYAARSRKASILLHFKRFDEALAVYDASLKDDPRDPWAWHNKSYALTQLGRYHEALACNERALAIMDFGTARQQRDIILKKMAEGEAAD